MGRKINPFVFRLGVIDDWRSRWFDKKKYKDFLREDYFLRSFLFDKLKKMGLEKIEIERSAGQIKILIFTSRPGLIIGRGGGGIEALHNAVEKKYCAVRKDKQSNVDIKLQIEELSKPDSNARIIGQQIADQLEKRISFRRTLKYAMEKVMQDKEIKGVKVMVAGRLDGKEMARVEWLSKGRMPLHTLRGRVNFATANAYCTYGVIGVKVWIYKGEIFEEKKN